MKAMSLQNSVKEWLKKQGYPLELRVAAAFRGAGFDVVQSTYLKDIESDKFREVDVLATMQYQVANGWWMHVSFTIECKGAATDKPWLVFTSDQHDIDDLFWLNWFPKVGVDGMAGALLLNRRTELFPMVFFNKSDKIGHSVTEALSNGKDNAYCAIMKAIGSAQSLLTLSERRIKPRFRIVEFAFPMVVTSAKLFGVHLDDSGEICLETVDNVVVPLRQWPPSVARIITQNHVQDFALQAYRDAKRFTESFAHDLLSRMEFKANAEPDAASDGEL